MYILTSVWLTSALTSIYSLPVPVTTMTSVLSAISRSGGMGVCVLLIVDLQRIRKSTPIPPSLAWLICRLQTSRTWESWILCSSFNSVSSKTKILLLRMFSAKSLCASISRLKAPCCLVQSSKDSSNNPMCIASTLRSVRFKRLIWYGILCLSEMKRLPLAHCWSLYLNCSNSSMAWAR